MRIRGKRISSHYIYKAKQYNHTRRALGEERGGIVKKIEILLEPEDAIDSDNIKPNDLVVRLEKHKFENVWVCDDSQLGAYREYGIYEVRGTEDFATGRKERGSELFPYTLNDHRFRRNGALRIERHIPIEASFFITECYKRNDETLYERTLDIPQTLPLRLAHESFTHDIPGGTSYQTVRMSIIYREGEYSVGSYPIVEKKFHHVFGPRIRWVDNKKLHESYELARKFIDTTAAIDALNIKEDEKTVEEGARKSVQPHDEPGFFERGAYKIPHSKETYGGIFQGK